MKSIYKAVIVLILLGIILSIPSVFSLIENKTIFGIESENYYFIGNTSFLSSIIGAIVFGIIVVGMFYIYLKLVKNSSEFKSIKTIICIALLVGLVFIICLPNTSSDLFYYMGTGRVAEKYGLNPYYVTIKQIKQTGITDQILDNSGVWDNTTVIYGPIWVTLTLIFNKCCFNSITTLLYFFKLMSLIMYLLTTWIIYKLTKKKKIAIMFAFNPLVILEVLVNCHNDIYVLFLILLGILFIKEARRGLSVFKRIVFVLTGIMCFAASVAIKYIALIIWPFIILYYLKDRKIKHKILLGLFYTAIFIVIIAALYLPWFELWIDSILGIFAQQGKVKDSIYLTIITLVGNNNKITDYIFSSMFFITLYIAIVMIFKQIFRETTFRKTMKRIYILLLLLTFGIITNLTSWYLLWLFVPFAWLSAKDMKNIIWLQFSYEITYLIFIYNHINSYEYEAFVLPIIAIIMLMRWVVLKQKKNSNNF